MWENKPHASVSKAFSSKFSLTFIRDSTAKQKTHGKCFLLLKEKKKRDKRQENDMLIVIIKLKILLSCVINM